MFVAAMSFDRSAWTGLCGLSRLAVRVDALRPPISPRLGEVVEQRPADAQVFYLATAPQGLSHAISTRTSAQLAW